MATYSTDKDINNLRPNILNNGQADFDWAHTMAYDEINSTLEAEWYMSVAPLHNVDTTQTGMDISKLVPAELKMLSVWKVYELIYISLAKDIVPTTDGPFAWAAWARQSYDEELARVLKVGPSYDWGGDGITQEDKFQPFSRKLIRC